MIDSNPVAVSTGESRIAQYIRRSEQNAGREPFYRRPTREEYSCQETPKGEEHNERTIPNQLVRF
jgi:hypothetical protein